MTERYVPCQAPEHVEGCSGQGSTRDHFTPKCIAKALGWSHDEINAPENIQHLSPECHKEKDADTPLRKTIYFRQINGETFTFEQHRDIFDRK